MMRITVRRTPIVPGWVGGGDSWVNAAEERARCTRGFTMFSAAGSMFSAAAWTSVMS